MKLGIITFFILFQLFTINGQQIGVNTLNPQGEFHVTLPLTYSGLTFTGTGINDLQVNPSGFNGQGTVYFIVQITNAGPNPNIFKYSNDNGVTWVENITASSSPINIGYGVFISFLGTYGHHFNDTWSWNIVQSYPDGLIVKYGNTALGHTNPNQRLDVSGGVKMDSLFVTSEAGNNKIMVSDAYGKGKWKVNNFLHDSDQDTKIEMEKTADQDTIRFTIAGSENWIMADNRIEPRNSGGSIYLGEKAGEMDDFSANENIGIGKSTLSKVTTGNNNIGFGSYSLKNLISGARNIAIGDSILTSSVNGAFNNIGIGQKILRSNLTGDGNIGVGFLSLYYNTIGSNNIAIGSGALLAATNSENIAIGSSALMNYSGSGNLAIGYNALKNNISGYGCVAIGYEAALNNIQIQSTAVGDQALRNNTTGWKNIAFGSNALKSNTSGEANTAIGYYALANGSLNSYNTAVGSNALSNNTTGDNNTAVGSGCHWLNTTGHDNTSIGYLAAYNNISGNNNTAIGVSALYDNQNGNNNIAIGGNAIYNNVGGLSNIGIGIQAVFTNTNGEGNIGVGTSALFQNTGSFNTAIGHSVHSGNDDYWHAIAIGATSTNTASFQARIGNSSISSIGGFANWSNVSDGRFKKNIKENVPGLSFIKKLRPVTYNLDVDGINTMLNIPDSVSSHPVLKEAFSIKSNTVQTGFIAQEVEASAKEMGYDFSGIDKDEIGLYGLRYAEFTVPLVKSVQELSQENFELKEEIKSISQNLAKLTSEINSLKQILSQISEGHKD